jgi:hypothetical protein
VAYATTAQLASFLDVDEADLPDDADRLLERASEVVDSRVRVPYDVDDAGLPSDPDIAAAFAGATCAQVEAWIAHGGDTAAVKGGQVRSFTSGKLSVTYAQGSAAGGRSDQLAPRASLLLARAGLLGGKVAV